MNGHDNGYAGFYVRVFSLHDPKLRPVYPTRAPKREMAGSLRDWCRVPLGPPYEDCRPFLKEADTSFNMSAIDWLPDSSGIALFGEVVPSSSRGIIMGQIRGYEIAIPGGQVLQAMTGRQFKARWRHSANWPIKPRNPIPRS